MFVSEVSCCVLREVRPVGRQLSLTDGAINMTLIAILTPRVATRRTVSTRHFQLVLRVHMEWQVVHVSVGIVLNFELEMSVHF